MSEQELLADTELLATGLGLHASPEGGACVAATRRLQDAGWIAESETVVLFNTGHALKYGG